MKIDFSQPLRTLTGQPLKFLDWRQGSLEWLVALAQQGKLTAEQFRTLSDALGAEEEVSTLTLERACVTSLLTDKPDGQQGAEAAQQRQYKAFSLMRRIHAAKAPVEVAAEEVALLKKALATTFSNVLVSGQAMDLLEGKPPLPSKDDPLVDAKPEAAEVPAAAA